MTRTYATGSIGESPERQTPRGLLTKTGSRGAETCAAAQPSRRMQGRKTPNWRPTASRHGVARVLFARSGLGPRVGDQAERDKDAPASSRNELEDLRLFAHASPANGDRRGRQAVGPEDPHVDAAACGCRIDGVANHSGVVRTDRPREQSQNHVRRGQLVRKLARVQPCLDRGDRVTAAKLPAKRVQAASSRVA